MPIDFSCLSGTNDACFGKLENPIKELMENEFNTLEKKKSILDYLYNVEKSSHNSENDTISKDFFYNFGFCILFQKAFTITREMASNASIDFGTKIKARAKALVRAYFETRIRIAEQALINGTNTFMIFNKCKKYLAVEDHLPLFSNAHKYEKAEFSGKTQSNYFYSNTLCASRTEFKDSLNTLATKMRNFKDENGEAMEYAADIVIIPSNRPRLEKIAKAVIGSERIIGNGNDDIILQNGNWSLVVLHFWETTDDRFMIMSSDANKALSANKFYNEIPLLVRSSIKDRKEEFLWNGSCRFNIGFYTWKHILLAVDSNSPVPGATNLNA